MKAVALVLLAMVAMAQFMVQPSEAISCNEVATFLSPCVNYLRSGGNPTEQCCNGVRQLQSSVPTQADRQTACNCAKSAAASMQIRPDAAADLPNKCHVSTKVPITPNVDCSSIP